MSVVGIIPARYASTRFPGKALAMLNGAPLIQHVYEQAKQATQLAEVLVATDDERIVQAVERFGGKAVMTSPDHRSGTERVAQIARQVTTPVFINIQGDEPLIRPEQIDQLAEFLSAHQAVPMATLMTPLTRQEDASNPNVVKVVVDQNGYALYFSRATIPFERANRPTGQPANRSYKHLGLYGYQRYFLLRYPHLTPTPLEQMEQLEQLRVLEHGYRMKVLETPYDTVGVDTPEDLRRVEQVLMEHGAGDGGRGSPPRTHAPRPTPLAPSY